MKVVIRKRKYKLLVRKQYTATILSLNGRAMFRSTESYNNLEDLFSALATLFGGGAMWTVKLPGEEEGRFFDRDDFARYLKSQAKT